MFFLKELPSRQMVEQYSETHQQLDVDACLGALYDMRRASTMVRRLEAYFAEHDFSQLRFLILMVINREPGRDSIKISEIVDRLDVSKPVMTRTIARLESDALIAIQDHPGDGRAKSVSLTDAGHAKLSSILPDYFELLSELGRGEER